jgi:predicted Rossmann-fold nucleotide-binding protein
MKLIIAGGRNYRLTQDDYKILDGLLANVGVKEVVHGGATGADACGKEWAESRGIPVTPFDPDWDDLSHPNAVIRYRRDGKPYDAAAGPRRNAEMASYADAVAIFPGGRGTQSMYDLAKKAGIMIFDFRHRVFKVVIKN